MTAMKKIFISFLLAVAALSVQSCLFEQADIFDASSSHRLAEAMDDAQKALVSSEYGWLFEIYPEGNQKYGGYAFVCKFNEDRTVDIWSELSDDPSAPLTSYYKMNNDNGPCLLFDTYNEYMHFFSTPSSSRYQAYEGEFEFLVTKIEQDLITVRGPLTGNTMYLRRMTGPAAEYLATLPSVEERIVFSGFKGNVGGQELSGELDIDNRQVTFTYGDESVKRAYSITPDGFRLYQPVELGGTEFYSFAIAEDGATVTPLDGGSSGNAFPTVFPAGYLPYADYAGDYIFSYTKGDFPVTLVPSGDGVHYQMTGINSRYDLVLTWSKAKGNLSLLVQMLYDKENPDQYLMVDGKYVGITAASPANATASSAYLNYTFPCGMQTVWNEDRDNPVFEFKDNGVYSGHAVSCFWMYTFTGPTQTSASKSSTVPAELNPFGQSTRNMNFIVSLTRVDSL